MKFLVKNCFAAPIITALAYDIIKDNPNVCLEELKEELKKKYVNYNKNSQIIYNNFILTIDIPIIVLYNYSRENEFSKNLTEKFRRNGHNAISIFEDESEEDVCTGCVSINNYLTGGKNTFKESIQSLYNVLDPDIIIVSIDMLNYNQVVQIKEIESYLEVDIEIRIYETLNLEIMSNNETKTFTLLDNANIDSLYEYLITLFDKDEVQNEAFQ